MTEWIRWSALEEEPRHRGHYRRQVEFPTCYLALHRYTADGEGYDNHSHVETQVGYVLQGEMAMLFEDTPVTVAAGQSYAVPTLIRHGGRSPAKTSKVVNIYVKKHLVEATSDAPRSDEWAAFSPPVTACGVRQRLLRLAPHAAPPPREADALDAFDILVGGEFASLEQGDVMRCAGDACPTAGGTGASLFRLEILALRETAR